jgi:hypothetical protein
METFIPFEVSAMWSDPFGFSNEVLLAVSVEGVLQHKAASQKLYPHAWYHLTSVLRLTKDSNWKTRPGTAVT